MTQKNSEKEKFLIETNLSNGVDLENRIIRISGHIGDPGSEGDNYFDFDTLDMALCTLERRNLNPITVRIYSSGGSVYEALAMVGRLKESKCEIITQGYGAIMSAATLLLMCGDRRRLSSYAVTMFHASQYKVNGDHESIKEQVAQAEKEEKLWAKYYEEFSNKSAKWWTNKIKKTEFHPSPEEMLALGAVDELF